MPLLRLIIVPDPKKRTLELWKRAEFGDLQTVLRPWFYLSGPRFFLL